MAGESEIVKPNFTGKYSLIKNENFDAFLAANGANWFIRKMVGNSSPSTEIIQDGDKFCIKLSTIIFTKESQFVVGEEFEEAQPNGVVMLVNTRWEDGKLVTDYVPKVEKTGKPQTQTRELEGDVMTMTMKVDDVVAKRIFKRESGP